MGARLTQRTGAGVAYAGHRTKYPGMHELNLANSLTVAARREVMDRLAEYEDTGLTPQQIMELLQGNLPKN